MTKRTLKIKYSDEHAQALNLTPEQFEAEMRLVVAAELCKREVLSTGAAAEFAGVSKPEFLVRMGEFDIPAFDLTPEELEKDVETATRYLKK